MSEWSLCLENTRLKFKHQQLGKAFDAVVKTLLICFTEIIEIMALKMFKKVPHSLDRIRSHEKSHEASAFVYRGGLLYAKGGESDVLIQSGNLASWGCNPLCTVHAS